MIFNKSLKSSIENSKDVSHFNNTSGVNFMSENSRLNYAESIGVFCCGLKSGL